MSASPVIELKKVERHYQQGQRKLTILSGIDFALNRGEMVALVAPSGTGKSTLLHTAGLLERPDGGDVILGGRACGRLSDDDRTAIRRNDIGFVYQFHHLLPEFSAVENIMMPQMIKGLGRKEARERAAQLLDYMQIGKRAEHRPSELSGGEQQRVAIARALLFDPRIVFADEPTASLDAAAGESVIGALAELAEAGKTVIVVSHDPQLLARAGRVIRLDHGRLADREQADAA